MLLRTKFDFIEYYYYKLIWNIKFTIKVEGIILINELNNIPEFFEYMSAIND